MKQSILFFSFFQLLVSYNSGNKSSNSTTNVINDNVELTSYSCRKIGWSCNYPSNWEVLSSNEIVDLTKTGTDAIEETFDTEIENNTENLLFIKKDNFNSFISTIQPFNTEIDGDYSESQELIVEILTETFKNKNIPFDHKTSSDTIDGLVFFTFESKIYATHNKKKVILEQIMFDRLINNQGLTLTLNYNNESDKNTLLDIIKSSKILQRN